MNSARRLITLPLLVLSMSCRARPALDAPAPLGQSFALDSLGRIVVPANIRIALHGVTEDSRCAVGVQCVWAGRALVRLQVDSMTQMRDVELRTDSATTSVFGHTITLDSVLPYPKAGQAIQRESYRAWVHVTQP